MGARRYSACALASVGLRGLRRSPRPRRNGVGKAFLGVLSKKIEGDHGGASKEKLDRHTVPKHCISVHP